jgi:uncharacterized damage-inducible protein DinB
MNLKDVLELYAKYNRHANGEMVRILKTLPESRFFESAGSYYKSIAGLAGHALSSTAGTLRRIGEAGFQAAAVLPALADFPKPPAGPVQGWLPFATLGEYETLRTKADEALIAACSAADENELGRTFGFAGRDGQTKIMAFGGNLLALFTHEVHHRGGVSTILDGWGVENDWSSLMRFLFL